MGRVSLSSLTLRLHPHSRPFLLARVRVHPRAYVCIIYATKKVNSGIAWSENKTFKPKRSIQGTSWWLPSQEWGRDLSLSRATGLPSEMFEASWCARALWFHTGHAGILSTHLMLTRFLLVLKMSVLDIIRETVSLLSVSPQVCLENGKRDCER